MFLILKKKNQSRSGDRIILFFKWNNKTILFVIYQAFLSVISNHLGFPASKTNYCISGSLGDLKGLHLQVVKVADFGVARVKSQTGVMTAETGTYRWMAPEVCLFVPNEKF